METKPIESSGLTVALLKTGGGDGTKTKSQVIS